MLRMTSEERAVMTASCRDCDDLPKVPDAGVLVLRDDVEMQVMHNGVLVVKDCYGGPWMTELIGKLRGHHEPQEERAFYEIVQGLRDRPVMIECGSYWAYYSMWFKAARPKGRAICIEPDPSNFEVGRRNFALNSMEAEFLYAAVSDQGYRTGPFRCETDDRIRQMRFVSMPEVMEEFGVDRVDVLFADVQGGELALVKGAAQLIRDKRIAWIVLSTHHHDIAGTPTMHWDCLKLLAELGARIEVEHTVSESYSGDGLIVAAADPSMPPLPPIPISRNIVRTCLWMDTEFDLAAALAARQAPVAPPPPLWRRVAGRLKREALRITRGMR